jgi:hypothetical protein
MRLMLAQTFSSERAKWRIGGKKVCASISFFAPASKHDSGSNDWLNTNDTHSREWLTLIAASNCATLLINAWAGEFEHAATEMMEETWPAA